MSKKINVYINGVLFHEDTTYQNPLFTKVGTNMYKSTVTGRVYSPEPTDLVMEIPVEGGAELFPKNINGLTVEWADEKGLNNPIQAPTQFMKIMEELGETSSNFLRMSTSALDTDDSKKQYQIHRNEVIDGIGDTMVTIAIFAHMIGLNAVDCWHTAYDVIKNRKGELVNNTFIKEGEEK